MLSTNDWQEMDQVILRLHHCSSLAALKEFILEALPCYLGATFASWNEHGEDAFLNQINNSSSHHERVMAIASDLNATLSSHPVFPKYVDSETGKVIFLDQVLRTRALTDTETFRTTPVYQKAFKPMSIEDQLIMHVFIEESFGIILTFQKESLFTEKEHLKASILRGHIIARLYTLQREEERESERKAAILKELSKILSSREMEVLKAVCHGNSNREIASRLSLSTRTVDSHVSNLLERLETTSRFHLIARYSHWLR
ncbi:MAG: helix-turn-helix transcriptional regulator [Verrucomicrobiota bacterium JB023]|nr:helix-turn-helix transcriptional regulator [Verrucomicrobiota bacterium JB023]